MSTHEDDAIISGTSLDVAEQKGSSPAASGTGTVSGLSSGSYDINMKGCGKSDTGSVKGNPDGNMIGNRTRSNDSSEKKAMTLMRTQSAPPDEHAGAHETGNSEVSGNQFASLFGGQTLIDPGSNAGIQTSSVLPQPFSQSSSVEVVRDNLATLESRQKLHQPPKPSPSKQPQHGSFQHGSTNSSSHYQPRNSQKPVKQQFRSHGDHSQYDPSGMRVPTSKFTPPSQQPTQYPQYSQSMYLDQQQTPMIGVNQMQHQQQGGLQSQHFVYYQTPGAVQAFPQQSMQFRGGPSGGGVALNATGGSQVDGQFGNSNLNGSSNRANGKVGAVNSPEINSSPIQNSQGSPHVMQQKAQPIVNLSTLPPPHSVVQQQPHQVGGVMSYPMMNMMQYPVQPPMRNGQLYTTPMTMPYPAMHQSPQMHQLPPHQLQQSLHQPSAAPAKEKRKLVLKDKEGNIIEVENLVKKDNSSSLDKSGKESSLLSKSSNSPAEMPSLIDAVDELNKSTLDPSSDVVNKEESTTSTVIESSGITLRNESSPLLEALSKSIGNLSLSAGDAKFTEKNNEESLLISGNKSESSNRPNDKLISASSTNQDELSTVIKGGEDEIRDSMDNSKRDIGFKEDLIPIPQTIVNDVDSTNISSSTIDASNSNSKLNISASSETESCVTLVPPIMTLPKPVMSPGGVLEKRIKRNKIMKEKLAQADATSNANKNDLLDAYTSSVKHEEESQKDPEIGAILPTSESNDLPLQEEEADSWEVTAMKIEQAMEEEEKEKEKEKPPMPVKRSLRPGGGLEKKSGVPGAAKQNIIRYVFKKHEITRLKPSIDRLERPRECAIYNNIIVIGGENTSGRHQGGNWKGGQGGHHSQGGSSNMQQQQHPGSGDTGWQRGQVQPPYQHGGARKNRGPAPPMVKKVITDPMEVLTREVTDILNKITPQTFEKLTSNLCEIQVQDLTMLEALVRLIFDKAVTEPNYAMLYADMCQTLDSSSDYSSFFNVVFNRDSHQYFWIRELQYNNELAGPYGTPEECVNAIVGDVPPPLNAVNHQVALDQIIVVNGILVSIIKSVDREEYFASFVPLADVEESMKSPHFFGSHGAALKSGMKKHSFHNYLVTICQEEYMQSVASEGIYAEPALRRAQLMEQKPSMDPDEFEVNLEELNNFEMAIKKRKMGNIRFIGELCKRKMIKTNTMHHCILNLLTVEDGEKIDGGNIELVCKLLTSVGQKLDAESSTNKEREVMDSYFSKLADLRKNKTIFSRIRFSIDEVIELRRNNWVARVEQDGPTTLEEIRKRVADDEERKSMAQQQLHGGFHGGKGRSAIRTGSGDARNVTKSGQVAAGRVKGNDRRSGGGDNSSRTALSRGGKPSDHRVQGKQSSISQSHTSVPKEKEMSLDLQKKRTATILSEFISTGNVQEAMECMAELPSEAAGFLVTNIVDKYMNSIKEGERDSILKLCDVLMPILESSAKHIERSIETCDNILFLVDFMMDVKMAPELIGDILNVLVKGRACRRVVIDQLLVERRKANKEDEYGVPDEEIQAAHDRLRAKLL